MAVQEARGPLAPKSVTGMVTRCPNRSASCSARGAEGGGQAGSPAVDDDVGLAGQLDQPAPVDLAAGVQDVDAFIGVVQGERDADAGQGGQLRAGRTAPGRLDFEHVRTEIGQQSGGRFGVGVAQVEHPQATPTAAA